MSSLVDIAINSDQPPPASAPPSSGPSRSGRRQNRAISESAGVNSDIDGGFADDEVVGARGTANRPKPPTGDIPKLVDVPGERVAESFEDFLEK